MTKQAKSKNHNKSKSLVLSKSEIEKLFKITEQFKDVERFTIEQDNSSGIGSTYTVKFDLFDKNDTKIDITDVANW